MSYPVPVFSYNTGSNTSFGQLFDIINTMANLFSYSTITANSLPGGAVTTGNAWVNGSFGSTKLYVGSLAGGNIASPSTLNVTSNVVVGQTSIYTNGSITTGSVTINPSSITVNGVAVALTNALGLGFVSNGSVLATRSKINFISGTGITVVVTDDGTDGQVNVAITAISNSSAFTNIAGLSGPTANASQLSTALGLGNAAYQNTGTGGVALYNDPRITNAANTSQVNAAIAALSSNNNPIVNGITSPGTSNTLSRSDHVHPTDTTRLAISSALFEIYTQGGLVQLIARQNIGTLSRGRSLALAMTN